MTRSTVPFGFALPVIPALKTIIHRPYIGLDLDELHNEIPCWDDPVEVKVQCWEPKTVQSYSGDRRTRGMWQSREITEIDLFIPPDLDVKVRDRFTLPAGVGREPTDYEADEITDANNGWHGWQPGYKIHLKRINPIGRPVDAEP